MSDDAELAAVLACTALLDALPHPARLRVLRLLATRVLAQDLRARVHAGDLPAVAHDAEAGDAPVAPPVAAVQTKAWRTHEERVAAARAWTRCGYPSPFGSGGCVKRRYHADEHRNRAGSWPQKAPAETGSAIAVASADELG